MLLAFFQPQLHKKLGSMMKTKKATSCISPRQTRTLFLLLVLLASTSSPSMSIWYTRSCGWNGDFHRKIPGVEVNVVRIQIDILFPLFFFSFMCCGTESAFLVKRGVRDIRDDTKRARSELLLLLVLLFVTSEKSNLLFPLQCFEILIASLSDRKLMFRRLDRCLTAWEWFSMVITNEERLLM